MSDQAPVAEASPSDRHAWALSAGGDWADLVRAQLRQQGRPATGGWPGTVSEARIRAFAGLHQQSGILPEEHANLALVLYAAAKKSWHERQEPAPCEHATEAATVKDR